MSSKLLVLCALLMPTLALGQANYYAPAPFAIGGGYQNPTTATFQVTPLANQSFTGCWALSYSYSINNSTWVQVPPSDQPAIKMCGPYSNSTSINITAPATYRVSAILASPPPPGYPGQWNYSTDTATINWPGPGTPTATSTPGSGKFTISWPAVTNTYDQNKNLVTTAASAYNVKISGTSGGPYSTVAPNTTALSWTDPSVALNAVYYVVVSAVNSYGVQGPNSAEVRASASKVAPMN